MLQKLAYIGVIFGLLPLMVLTGLTMSPAVTAALPFLFDMFGGRQSARTIHFVVANLLVLFVLVHVVQVHRRAGERDAIDDHGTFRDPAGGATMTRLVTRRGLIAAGSAAAASLVVRLRPRFPTRPLRWFLDFGEFMSLHAQRLLLARSRWCANIPRSRYLAGVSAQRDGTPQRPCVFPDADVEIFRAGG